MSSIIIIIECTFVVDKLITNSVMVGFEASPSINYGKVNDSNHFALKLDFGKAFDKIEWNYLEAVILPMSSLLAWSS